MKTVSQFVLLLILIYLCLLNETLNANWKKAENINSRIPNDINSETRVQKKDSLPAGITKDWLNKLTDEGGNRILPEEEPVTDALQQMTFDGVAGEEYGKSVSSAGDVNGDGLDDVIIGAPSNIAGGINAGRAYIYFGGTIIDNSVDVILTGAANDYFGRSVSAAGDVNSDGYDDVIVGAYGSDSFTGRAYIYFGGASMNSVADVTMLGESSQNNFGYSVSEAGDVNADGFPDVIVGAYGVSGNTGKTYIYFGGTSMNNSSDVIMTGENVYNNFGYSVSDAGDVNGDGYDDVITGAYGFNSGFGRAYIYYGGMTMDNTADVNMTGGTQTDYFGISVSTAGDVNDDGYSDVIIGSYGYNSFAGGASVFYGGASMNSTADVTMTGEAGVSAFGHSVSAAGDVNGDGFADVFVGAYAFSSSSAKGRAYLYYGGTNMNNEADIFITGENSGNYFGYSVSGGGDINGDGLADMITGAFGYNSSAGRTYIYTNTLRGSDIADLTMTGEAVYNYFGISVSSAGDVNGDGYDDVIVGADRYNAVTGRVYIYFGGMFMNNVADVILTGDTGNVLFGNSVSGAGDVNNDGFEDVIVGAENYNSNRGRAYIYYGGMVMNNVADVIMTGTTLNSYFGREVCDAGDVNGDGFDDVLVSAPTDITGKAYIYLGSISMDNVADIELSGEYSDNSYGNSASGAGDVNGDGFDDVIVGSSGLISFLNRAYVYYGGAAMDNTADVNFTGANYSNFGASVSGAGDLNGDGFDDVIISSSSLYTFTYNSYIFFGSSSMNNVADVTINVPSESVSGAGDVNGDGYDDVIIGAYIFGLDTSSAFIYFGGLVMDNISDITMNENNSFNDFGTSVSGAGDINGDGNSDVIVGAPRFDSYRGKACIYLSSPPDNRKNLFTFGAIQGMYDPVLDTEVPDTIKVYLRNSTSPFARVDSSTNILLGPGTGQNFLFRNVQNGIPYYIEVTHRNALSTWSASPVSFVNSDASIAFSVDEIYAYGNNEIQVDNNPYNVFAFYSGDVNQDGYIDLNDITLVFNDASSFVTGYVVTDLTGDNIVDLTDLTMTFNNSSGFVSVIKP